MAWLGCLPLVASSNPCQDWESEREGKGHRQRELRQLSALQPSRTRTHCAASVRGSVCTHVSPHVAHVCATLRLAVPCQGHDADADADGHARNAVAAFIELAPDFLWAILLSLPLSPSLFFPLPPRLDRQLSLRKGVKSHKDTRTLQLQLRRREVNSSLSDRLPYATQQSAGNAQLATMWRRRLQVVKASELRDEAWFLLNSCGLNDVREERGKERDRGRKTEQRKGQKKGKRS